MGVIRGSDFNQPRAKEKTTSGDRETEAPRRGLIPLTTLHLVASIAIKHVRVCVQLKQSKCAVVGLLCVELSCGSRMKINLIVAPNILISVNFLDLPASSCILLYVVVTGEGGVPRY